MNYSLEISKKQAVKFLRFLYPVWLVIGLLTFKYLPALIGISEDAVVTANNIGANEFLFRAAIAGNLLTQIIHIIVVLVLYKLFVSVDRNQSNLLLVVGLIGVPIAMLSALNEIAALLLISNPDQMQFFLGLSVHGTNIAAIFWGLWLLPQAALTYKSGYFPKIFSYLMYSAGIAYTVMSFVKILFPEYLILINILDTITMGEVVFMIWVMFKGAKLPEGSI
jgi:hypothetical protein